MPDRNKQCVGQNEPVTLNVFCCWMRTSANLDIHFILGEGVQSKVLEHDDKWEPGGDFEQYLYYQCEGKVGDYSTVDESFFCYLKTQQIPKHRQISRLFEILPASPQPAHVYVCCCVLILSQKLCLLLCSKTITDTFTKQDCDNN